MENILIQLREKLIKLMINRDFISKKKNTI